MGSGRFAGVILDLGLPDGSGLELLARLRVRAPSLPVLVLTGKLERHIINRVQELRAEYVVKPAALPNLTAFVHRALCEEQIEDNYMAKCAAEFVQRMGLTRRETELLAHALNGVSRKDLADQLGVTENTAKTLVRSLVRKAGAASLSEVVQNVTREALHIN